MPRRVVTGFIWIAPNRATNWSLTIKDVDVSDRVLSGTKIPFGLIEEDLHCEIMLENSDDVLDNTFTENDVIVFKMDYDDGTTIQFEGEVESVFDEFDSHYRLRIIGSHYTTRMADIMVTKEYTNSLVSDIKSDLVSNFMVGYTTIAQSPSISGFSVLSSFSTTQVETTQETITTDSGVEIVGRIDIKFVKKPLLDCFIDLNIQGDEDTYVGNDKIIRSFKRGSKINDNESLVIDENMFELKGLGKDNTIKKNKLQVFGTSGGLPVIFSKSNISSTSDRVREQIIEDSNAIDEEKAEVITLANIDRMDNPDKEGDANIIMTPNLVPGSMTYVIMPPKVHERLRISKYTFLPFENRMEVVISQTRTLARIFKERILKDLGQENIVNPYDMNYSYNFTFDDENKIDSLVDAELVDGKLKKYSGVETGVMTSNILNTPVTVTSVHVLAIGESIDGATYWINADGTTNWQQVSLDTLTTINTSIQGMKLRLKIEVIDTNTRIDSAVVLYKG